MSRADVFTLWLDRQVAEYRGDYPQMKIKTALLDEGAVLRFFRDEFGQPFYEAFFIDGTSLVFADTDDHQSEQ